MQYTLDKNCSLGLKIQNNKTRDIPVRDSLFGSLGFLFCHTRRRGGERSRQSLYLSLSLSPYVFLSSLLNSLLWSLDTSQSIKYSLSLALLSLLITITSCIRQDIFLFTCSADSQQCVSSLSWRPSKRSSYKSWESTTATRYQTKYNWRRANWRVRSRKRAINLICMWLCNRTELNIAVPNTTQHWHRIVLVRLLCHPTRWFIFQPKYGPHNVCDIQSVCFSNCSDTLGTCDVILSGWRNVEDMSAHEAFARVAEKLENTVTRPHLVSGLQLIV